MTHARAAVMSYLDSKSHTQFLESVGADVSFRKLWHSPKSSLLLLVVQQSFKVGMLYFFVTRQLLHL